MQVVSSYYNTNYLTGEELKRAVKNAQKQEDAILLIYQNTGRAHSPSQIHSLMQKAGKSWPLTSCRRAITNLTDKGLLIKTNEMMTGSFGKPEFKWILKHSKQDHAEERN